jgi:hypothetical protein
MINSDLQLIHEPPTEVAGKDQIQFSLHHSFSSKGVI